MQKDSIGRAGLSRKIIFITLLNVCFLTDAAIAIDLPDDPNDMIYVCTALILVSSYLYVGDPAIQKSAETELSRWKQLTEDDTTIRNYASDFLYAFGSGEISSTDIIETADICKKIRKTADGEE